MTTETDSSYLPQSSSLLPTKPQNPVDHLSSNDSSTQGLQNEGMNNNGFQIPSSDGFYSFQHKSTKKILLSYFDLHEPDNIAREANDEELSKPHATTDGGFEALTKNLKQCEIWNGLQGNNNQEDQIYYTIEGSAYMISRKPFDPIGRPFNSFGLIERPFPRLPSSDELADLGFASNKSFMCVF